MDRDRIAHLNRFEELVAEHVDRHNALFLPDVGHEHAGGGQRIDWLREKYGLEADATYISNGLLRARPGLPVTPLTEEEMAQRQAVIDSQLEPAGGEEEDSGEEE